MKDDRGNGYWNAGENWVLDREYHFRDIIAVPGEENDEGRLRIPRRR